MQSGTYCIIFLCFLSLAVFSGDCKGLFNEYLERPNLASLSNSTQSEAIKKWLKTVEVKPGSSIPSVLSQLEGAAAKEKDPVRADYYKFLISLATTGTSNTCQQYLFDFFLEIYRHVEEPRQTELADFMDYYGREKFRDCIEYQRL